MGICTSKPSPNSTLFSPVALQAKDNSIPTNDTAIPDPATASLNDHTSKTTVEPVKKSPLFPFYSPSPAHRFFSKKSSPARSPARNAASANSTPKRFFKRPFPPPSPAKHIRAVLARRHGSVKPNEAAIPEGSETGGEGLDKSFGFSKHFGNKYELGDEVGRGHFGYTCQAKFKKGELKGQQVAVKVIPKAKVFFWFYLIWWAILCNWVIFGF